MNRNLYIAILLSTLLVVGGCATPTTKKIDVSDVLVYEESLRQKSLAFKVYFERIKRLHKLAHPLKESALIACEEKHIVPVAGFLFYNLHTLPEGFRDVAQKEYGFDDTMKIVDVIPDSPASKSGMQINDILVSVDGINLSLGEKGLKHFGKVWDDNTKDGVVNLLVLRDGEQVKLEVHPSMSCQYPVLYANSEDTINAYADGENIYITKGFTRFANDLELSTVIAHEIAHNGMQHIEAKQKNSAGGLILDILIIGTTGIDIGARNIAAGAYSKEFESEADYVGLYIMANAGLDIEQAPNVWRRIAVESPEGIDKNISSFHPSTPERFVSMQNAIEEISAKIRNGEKLVPNLKEEK